MFIIIRRYQRSWHKIYDFRTKDNSSHADRIRTKTRTVGGVRRSAASFLMIALMSHTSQIKNKNKTPSFCIHLAQLDNITEREIMPVFKEFLATLKEN